MKNPPDVRVPSLIDVKAAELLRKSADVLAKYGWCVDSLGILRGPKCVLGAMNAVTDGSPLRWGLNNSHYRRAVAAVVTKLDLDPSVGCYTDPLANWNNSQTNANVVIRTLRTVASELDAVSPK